MKHDSITSLPRSPESERRERVIKYSVAMGVRTLCVISLFFVHGWWLLAPALGAVFLPYFAVVVANAQRRTRGDTVERPGNVIRSGRADSDGSAGPSGRDRPDGEPGHDDGSGR